MKKSLLIVFLWLFIACSNNDDTKENQEPKDQTEQNTPSIVIKKGETNTDKNDQWVNYNIHGEKSIKFGIGDEENSTTKSIGAIAMIKSPIQTINKNLIRTKLSKNFLLKCSACHDDYANGIIGPSLLTKTSDEIYDMIHAYKSKSKINVLMNDLINKMDDKEIRSLADEISTFNKQFREQQ